MHGGQSMSCVTGRSNLPSIRERLAGAFPTETESGVVQLNQVYNSCAIPVLNPLF